VELSTDTARRLLVLEERGCVVHPPAHAPAEHAPGVDWECTVILPDGEEMTGRGRSPEEAAAAAAARTEAAPQLRLLRPGD
jgi:hypothetical protein